MYGLLVNNCRDWFALYCGAHQTAGRPRRLPGLAGIKRDPVGFLPLICGILQPLLNNAVATLVSRQPALRPTIEQILAGRSLARCTREAT